MSKVKNGLSNLSSPFSAGAGGVNFEHRVQTVFIISLITNSFTPVLNSPLDSLTFQSKYKGWHTDDILAESGNAKLLCQIKHKIRVTYSDKEFHETILAAWADFNNEDFNRTTDRICLITQDIPVEYASALYRIHEYAQGSENADDFIIKTLQERVSNEKMRNSLNLINNIITKASVENTSVAENELWEFCKVFCILVFDLDYEYSVNKILCAALLKKFAVNTSPEFVWSKLFEYATYIDENASTITNDSIPDDIKKYIIDGKMQYSQSEYNPDFEPSEQLALLAIIGTWYDGNKYDQKIISTILQKPYAEIRNDLAKFSNQISCKNGKWTVNGKETIIEQSCMYLDDTSVSRLFTTVGTMLIEKSDHEDYSDNNRIKIRSNGVNYNSLDLIEGVIEGICILSNLKDIPKHWSSDMIENNRILFIRDVFLTSNWTRWASLADYLQLIAEICPNEYLNQLENFLIHKPEEAIKLVSYKRGYFSLGYTPEIIWSLEALAWSTDFLITAIICLGELAEIKGIDEKGNSPVDSIVRILLPWKPQTTASHSKQINALEALHKSSPDIAWTVIQKLLPGVTNFSFENAKPKYLIGEIEEDIHPLHNIKQDFDDFTNLAIKWADDTEKLLSLLHYSEKLSEEHCLLILQQIEMNLSNINEIDKYKIWIVLQRLEDNKSKIYANNVARQIIKKLIDLTKPEDIRIQYRYYFEDESIFKHISYRNYINRQKKAVKEIYLKFGVIEVLSIAKELDNNDISSMLGNCIYQKDLNTLIEAFSEEENKKHIKISFSSYFRNHQITSLSRTSIKQLPVGEICDILSLIPISVKTIDYISNLLGSDENLFWKKTHGSCHQCFTDESSVKILSNKLMKYGRNRFLMDQLEIWKNYIQYFSQDELFQMLSDAVTETEDSYNNYAIRNIFEYLYELEYIDRKKLAEVECLYITFFDNTGEFVPKGLTYVLNNDPMEFCEFLKILYRKKHEDISVHESESYNESVITLALYVLNTVHVIPGTDWDGTFYSEKCTEWIERAEKWANENDRYEIALIKIGEGLSFATKDQNGLPDKVILDILNKGQYQYMREGYRTGLYNQRGVFTVDPEGTPEIILSEKFKKQADILEKEGFARVSKLYNDLADEYEQDAKKIRDMYL